LRLWATSHRAVWSKTTKRGVKCPAKIR
jgi:hypothetical protein